ncbi:MAG: PTS sugar transporter subunit IIA [Spirochaetota bacterium]|nr:MAG: PTS sugar transporter subunit IIA [Spirochaetota bacterium]
MGFELLYMQIFCFGFLTLSAFFIGKLTRILHIGEVVGQVIGGLVVGPLLLFFIEYELPVYKEALQSLHFITFLFLSIVVFGIGEELSVKKIKKVGRNVLLICFIQAFLTFLFVSSTFLFLGFKPIFALIIGSIGIATAPASTFVIMNRLEITGKIRSIIGGIVILDDIIEVIVFSIMAQIALVLVGNTRVSLTAVLFPVVKEFGFAILLGVGIFLILRLVLQRRWLKPKKQTGMGPILGSEFLSRLISEMPGTSMQMFIIIWGSVCVGISLALHWHLPFLITAVTAGILISNLYSRMVFESLRIENATPLFTILFFALIGASAPIESFHPENYLFIGAYIVSRAMGKIGGTWFGCKLTHQEKRLTQVLPKLMLQQAGVAAIEAFFIASVLGAEGEIILGIVLPGLVFFEIVGVLTSERALLKWRSWVTGGGELIGEEEIIREKLKKERIDIYSLIHPECLRVPMNVKSKGEAIWELICILHSNGFIENPGEILEIILQRERQGGTTLGEGIAILHGRIPGLSQPAVALGVLPKDHQIDFGGTEETTVDIIYLVLTPASKHELHLQILAAIARFLSDRDIRKRLRTAKDELEALEIIKEQSNTH